MNFRSISRAARVLLAVGAFATTTAGLASPSYAGGLCSPQPKPSINMGASLGYFPENWFTTVTVKLSNSSCTNVSVDFWTSDGTAEDSFDYVGVAKVRLTFTPGQTEKKFVISGVNDDVEEGAKSFFVNLANASGGTIPFAQKGLTVDGAEPCYAPAC